MVEVVVQNYIYSLSFFKFNVGKIKKSTIIGVMRKALGVVHSGTRGMHDNFARFVSDSREQEVTINDAM